MPTVTRWCRSASRATAGGSWAAIPCARWPPKRGSRSRAVTLTARSGKRSRIVRKRSRRERRMRWSARSLPAAPDEAARHGRKILVERAVSAREIEVSVLGNDDPIASLPGEIVYDGDWYDYATKYTEGQAQVVVPAPVTPYITERIRALAV